MQTIIIRTILNGARTITPEENWPQDNCPLDDFSPDYCLPGIAPRQIVSWIIAPRTIAPEESCLHRKAHKILSSKSKLSIYLNFSRLVIFSMKFYTTIQPLSTDITFTIYLAVHWNNL